eukprot:TRINITY_DN11000_c0_g4_i4.p2 TRINITY_DN11000_c0_g4~~TRINITY_DN11000_c0_g4_i4.p2  ORF type:complete len:121 (+),score=19.39 TRINITY_DN11000_c0_g4_i4:334-696(+)
MKDSELDTDRKSTHELSAEVIRRHNESKSIARKDANRSFVNLDDLDPKSRPHLQAELFEILSALIDRNEHIEYVQGLNDIAGVFMLILGKRHALVAAERVCLHYIKYLFYALLFISRCLP